MTIQDNTVQKLVRGRLFTSNVAHIIDLDQPPYPGIRQSAQPALCNLRPLWPGVWFFENVDDLPTCGLCLTAKEARSV